MCSECFCPHAGGDTIRTCHTKQSQTEMSVMCLVESFRRLLSRILSTVAPTQRHSDSSNNSGSWEWWCSSGKQISQNVWHIEASRQWWSDVAYTYRILFMCVCVCVWGCGMWATYQWTLATHVRQNDSFYERLHICSAERQTHLRAQLTIVVWWWHPVSGIVRVRTKRHAEIKRPPGTSWFANSKRSLEKNSLYVRSCC